MRLDGFDFSPTLQGDGIRLEPVRADHLPALCEAASDPATWAGHPARDRWRPEVFERYFHASLHSPGTLVAVEPATGRVAGCSRYYPAWNVRDGLAIGYTFLDRRLWGTGTNGTMKALMLDHAFRTFREVWFHIDPSNARSARAVEKLGATRVAVLEAPGGGFRACWRIERPD